MIGAFSTAGVDWATDPPRKETSLRITKIQVNGEDVDVVDSRENSVATIEFAEVQDGSGCGGPMIQPADEAMGSHGVSAGQKAESEGELPSLGISVGDGDGAETRSIDAAKPYKTCAVAGAVGFKALIAQLQNVQFGSWAHLCLVTVSLGPCLFTQ